MGSIILSALTRFGDRDAIGDERRVMTYASLGDALARVIAVFKALGLRPGEGFAMLVGNRVEQVVCQYAAVLYGLRYTPLHPLASPDTHRFIMQDAESACLVIDPALVPKHECDMRRHCPTVRHVLSLGPYPEAIDLLARMGEVAPAPLIDQGDPAGIAYLIYTGGTTGVPKGVMLGHQSIVATTVTQASDWDFPKTVPRFLAATPTSHASGAIVTSVLYRGGYVRLLATYKPDMFCRAVAAEKINFTFLVPTMIYALMDYPARHQHDLSSLETIMYGAAPMSADRLRAALVEFGPLFVQLYGQSEAPMVIATLRKSDHDATRPDRLASCGLPGPTVAVRLLDEGLREVSEGEVGEICVRGPNVMHGYWKRTELTDEAFKGGWLHTGDVARRSADGYLTIVDRTKDLIISGGFNIYPREVEDALLTHPAVSTTAVIGVADDKWGEAVTAFVVLRPGASATAELLSSHVRSVRGPIWAPKAVIFVEEIPVTSLGKVDRKALHARTGVRRLD